MPDRIDTKAVLEKYRKWAETAGSMHQFFVHRIALLAVWDALAQEIADQDEWKKAAEYLLEHYPEDVFPPDSNTPDAKAGTFARRLLTWLLDPAERARFAALAAEEEKP